MTCVSFFTQSDIILGFELTGHSGYSDAGTDIVCSAVSSAAYMTVNTVTDVLMLDPDIELQDGYMCMKLKRDDALGAQDILKGFMLHISSLSEQYNDYITVNNSEV